MRAARDRDRKREAPPGTIESFLANALGETQLNSEAHALNRGARKSQRHVTIANNWET